MKEYLHRRERSRKRSNAMGIVFTILVHGVAVAAVSMNGMTYLWPPTENEQFVLDFVEMEPEPVHYGRQPVAETVDKTKPVEIVQKSESPITAAVPKNETQESLPDDFGDVETPAPEPEEPQLDARASFPGMGKKPSSATTPHTATDSSATFKAGAPDGNSRNSTVDGSPNAHLQGREVLGYIPKPAYDKQESGKVVVKIVVTYEGVVKQATVADGTTVNDSKIIQEAINSAYKVKFSKAKELDPEHPFQEGTITYYFKLK